MSTNFNKIFGNLQPVLRSALIKIYDYQIMRIEAINYPDHNNVTYKFHIKNTEIGLINAAKKLGPSGLLECYLASKILGEGPKIFALSDRLNLEAMENIDIRIEIKDYQQCFPTMIVEFPEDYYKTKVAECPQFDSKLHNPIMVAIHHDINQQILIIGVYFYLNNQVKNQCFSFAMKHETNKTIDQLLGEYKSSKNYERSEKISESEIKVAFECTKAALNALGILYEFGMKKVGYTNPEYAKKLSQRMGKKIKRLDHDGAKKDKEELNSLPIVYDFKQEIKLYSHEQSNYNSNYESNKMTIRPHWRRGHRRRQHYGTGNNLIKIITIKPVLVNAELFKGNESDTQVEYHD